MRLTRRGRAAAFGLLLVLALIIGMALGFRADRQDWVQCPQGCLAPAYSEGSTP